MNIDKLLKDRSSKYGDFKDNCIMTSKLNKLFKLDERLSKSSTSYEFRTMIIETFQFVLHKLSRHIVGPNYHDDNFRDIVGYLTLLIKYIESTSRKDRHSLVIIDNSYNYVFSNEQGFFYNKIDSIYIRNFLINLNKFINALDRDVNYINHITDCISDIKDFYIINLEVKGISVVNYENNNEGN